MALRIVAGLVALLVGVAFAILYWGFVQDTLASDNALPQIDTGLSFIAVAFAGVVMAAIAAWFGVEFPKTGSRAVGPGIRDLGSRLLPFTTSDVVKVIVGVLYALLYFGTAAYALWAWREQGSTFTPQVLKDLVATAVGAAGVIVLKLFA